MREKELKLHIGCGDIYLDGWVNIDLDSDRADVKHDLTRPLPYDENSVDFIYSEHFIEHLTVDEGLKMLKECHRILNPGGVLRVATPDLDFLVNQYKTSWKDQDWIKTFGYEWLETRAEMLNLCFHEWGHKYLYNQEELARRLREAGFLKMVRKELNESLHVELRHRETRKDSRLVLEAEK